MPDGARPGSLYIASMKTLRVTAFSLFPLAACTDVVAIPFSASVGGQPLTCASTYAAVDKDGVGVVVNDARFYVHGVQVKRDDDFVDVSLAENSFQNGSVALLDFETGDGSCAATGSPQTHTVLTTREDVSDVTAVRFTLGVPQQQNHLDATTLAPPLNVPDLFWAWQSGFKYLKFDVTTADASQTPAYFHLGANGCELNAGGSPSDVTCAHRHQPVLSFDLDVRTQTINLDVQKLFADVSLTGELPEGDVNGCMSFPGDAQCLPMMSAAGVAFEGNGTPSRAAFSVVAGENRGENDVDGTGSAAGQDHGGHGA
jgi:uncharacterized repeat protein (TIGR04052 family)